MKKNNNAAQIQRRAKNVSKSLKRGGYITAVTVIAIAAVILLNLIVGQLPTSITEFDISDTKIYTVTDVSKEYIDGLTDDVELIILEESGAVDQRILKFIDNYASLSDHISYRQIDPVVNPSALTEYEASSGSIVVRNVSSGKQSVISLTDMFTYDQSYLYYYGVYYEIGLDAEGQLTSALDYVTSDNSYLIYTMTGHGESALATQLTDAIDKANLSTASVNLLEAGAVPDDCTVLLCNAPTSDLADDELTMLQNFMEEGGQVFLVYPASDETFTNWQTLLGDYGLTVRDGFIGDKTNYYANAQSYFYFFPTLSTTSSVTSPISSDNLALVINPRGMEETETDKEVTIDAFMLTSEAGFSELDSDTEQTYILGAISSAETENGESRLIVITSQYFIEEELLSSYSNIANADIFMNALTGGLEEVSNAAIAEKSLEISYNTVKNPGMWGAIFIFIIPVVTIGGGLVIWIKRRRR